MNHRPASANMSPANTHEHAAFIAAHRDLLLGRRKAIGWGASHGAPFFLAQAPYRFEFLIDRKANTQPGLTHAGLEVFAPGVLAKCSPHEYVIVLLADEAAYGAQIREEARKYGAFDVVRPLQPPSDIFDVHEDPRKARLLQRQNERAFRSLVRRLRPTQPSMEGRHSIALFIGSLSTGGAEKQIVLLALGLRKLGHEVHLLTVYPSSEGTEGWEKALAEAGVKRVSANDSSPSWWLEFQTPGTASFHIFRRYSRFTDLGNLHQLAFLYQHLLLIKPSHLISYLDHSNLAGAIGGIEANVPWIIMSGRNVHPGNLPDLKGFFFNKTQLPYAYRSLLSLPGVSLTNNSKAGARSYAEWLQLPAALIRVVPNAIESAVCAATKLREELQIPPQSKIILGVMRLSEEKDPFLFLEIIEQVSRSIDVTGLLVGHGPLAEPIRQRIDDLGFNDRIKLLGRRADIFSLMSEADLLLQTSREEGMPNVLLEAQICGCPIVASDVGGTREATDPCWHDYLYPYRDPIRASVLIKRLLSSREKAGQLANTAMQYVLGTRTAEQLARLTLLESNTITAKSRPDRS